MKKMFEVFDAMKTKDKAVEWIRNWFKENGPDAPAVLGISGGKDSTICAALCAEALGPERVFGILMPNGTQKDINDARRVCDLLGIRNFTRNIEGIIKEFNDLRPIFYTDKNNKMVTLSETAQARENLPPRVRMTLLYLISQTLGGRICNTCNKSEDYLGYSTRWGDDCGDFAPLRGLTCTEVIAIGDALGLPYDLVHKTPADGLCGKTDEDRFGFTYRELDMKLRLNNFDLRFKNSLPEGIRAAIKKRHDSTEFKRRPVAEFTPDPVRPYGLSVILGRFQPLHNGHLEMIRTAMSESGEVLILVGSAQESGTYNNPFSYEARKGMIVDALNELGLAGHFLVAPIEDAGLGNNSDWGDYVVERVKEVCEKAPDAFFTANENRRTSWFKNHDLDVIVLEKTSHFAGEPPLSASAIREGIYTGDTDAITHRIPETDWKYIKASGFIKKPPKKTETKSI